MINRVHLAGRVGKVTKKDNVTNFELLLRNSQTKDYSVPIYVQTRRANLELNTGDWVVVDGELRQSPKGTLYVYAFITMRTGRAKPQKQQEEDVDDLV